MILWQCRSGVHQQDVKKSPYCNNNKINTYKFYRFYDIVVAITIIVVIFQIKIVRHKYIKHDEDYERFHGKSI